MVNWKARVGAQIGQKPYPPTSVIIFRYAFDCVGTGSLLTPFFARRSGVLESDGNGVAQKEVRGLKRQRLYFSVALSID